ncbi:alkyl hydroperoxide reductase subunit F [uncultured Phocaeicola sp.]|uniref:alkyl hydroperoxide reductase subunit F n=1 Tax=uncultured Phocaeicola sp. TaxID=990718 RepID=UPI0025ABB73B|nr:alkyl hydroperoxide reductase subunit F [uncultured Phocaeicola sp.]
MLDSAIKEQLKGLFAQLDAHYTFDIFVHPRHESRAELVDLLEEVASCSEKLSCRLQESEGLKFILLKEGEDTGITFRAVPGGHEFTSLLMAVLNADGKGKNFPDEFITRRIRALRGPINLTTYLSLSCTNCPDVVQALNLMVVLNPQIRHQAVDGAVNEEEVNRMKVQAVPTVFADGEQIHVGRGSIGDLLEKLEARYGSVEPESFETKEYDVLVAGGPAGAAAAIYSARKGLRVAVVAERIGGQVNETMGIENLISVPRTTGKELAQDLKDHLAAYHIDVLENRRIEKTEVVGRMKVLSVKGGESYKAPVLIIATGANWRKLNVPGEEKYIGHGVAFCPHCDGPFYKDKEVAVIGGGNSGVEAAIDLAGICSKVTVFEFMETLKADTVLQEKVRSLPNVDIFTHTQTVEVLGDGDKVVGLIKKDRSSEKEEIFALDGIFVQIGLTANSALFKDLVETNRMGEILTDKNGRTSVKGVYAAGDVTDVSYKQIIIAMGEGAKAALAAFEDRMRGEVG